MATGPNVTTARAPGRQDDQPGMYPEPWALEPRDGVISRIVPTLTPGAGVTTSRAHVHYVVTEYGIAYLHGRDLAERARNLIAVAAPEFRADLEQAARRLRLIV